MWLDISLAIHIMKLYPHEQSALYDGCVSRRQCYGYIVTLFQSSLSRKMLISSAGTSRLSAKSFPFRKAVGLARAVHSSKDVCVNFLLRLLESSRR